MGPDEVTSGASSQTNRFVLNNLMRTDSSTKLVLTTASERRRSLADSVVMVVQWYEWIIGRSYAKRICALYPNENMHLHNRHCNKLQLLFEDEGLSSVFPLLAHVEVPGGLNKVRGEVD